MHSALKVNRTIEVDKDIAQQFYNTILAYIVIIVPKKQGLKKLNVCGTNDNICT